MALLGRISNIVMIRVACVIALVCLGFAHQPLAGIASTLTAAEIAALTLPDGTMPELCLPSEDGKSKPHAGPSTCEACRIGATALLPTPSDAVGDRMPFMAAVVLPQPAEAHHRQLFPPSSHPRAPPVTV